MLRFLQAGEIFFQKEHVGVIVEPTAIPPGTDAAGTDDCPPALDLTRSQSVASVHHVTPSAPVQAKQQDK